MQYLEAKKIADDVLEQIRPHCFRAEIAGSIRRLKPEVKDIEIVAIPKPFETTEKNIISNENGLRTGARPQKNMNEVNTNIKEAGACAVWLTVGANVKTQPFIDSKNWTFGEVVSIDENWIYIKWTDKPEPLQHYHYEAKDFQPHCT